jgi:hypothetical protein
MKAAILTRNFSPHKANGFIKPFYLFRDQLKLECGLSFEEIRLHGNAPITDELARVEGRLNCDAVFIQGRLFTEPEPSIKCFLESTSIKKVLFDDFDSTGSAHFDLLPFIDLYVKNQFLKDPDGYKRPHAGGRIFAESFIGQFQIAGSQLQSKTLQDGFEDRLILGWNSAVRKSYYQQFASQNFRSFKNLHRSIDIHCRMNVQEVNRFGQWYRLHRSLALENLIQLKDRYQVIASGEKISAKAHLKELRDSKICVSPFGYGEVCKRDMEGIIAGCLLVKPSMEHLKTEPNLYKANATYVPVRWDLSDLNEKCDYYLRNKNERENIIRNAEFAYKDYFAQKKFLAKINEIKDRLLCVSQDSAR